MQQLKIPTTNESKTYIGSIGDRNGDVYHLILLPGDNDDATWEEQMEWAKSQGGDLPNRIEQAMLWANNRDLFKKDWYWSGEQHEDGGAACAYGFPGGNQCYFNTSGRLRARCVRRDFVKENECLQET